MSDEEEDTNERDSLLRQQHRQEKVEGVSRAVLLSDIERDIELEDMETRNDLVINVLKIVLVVGLIFAALRVFVFTDDDESNEIILQTMSVHEEQKAILHYYRDIDESATNDHLKKRLKKLIRDHKVVPSHKVWAAFAQIDKHLPGYPCDKDPSHIPDIYSSNCWTPRKNVFRGQCGTYKKEGDCFNREHIWPKSWFEGDARFPNDIQTDLFELYPADGYVNSKRGNLPFGYVETGMETYTSSNGCKIGTCADPVLRRGGQHCFEPPDYLKGDISRSFFYLSTAYSEEMSCCDEVGVIGGDLKDWMENTMREWHAHDAVDDMERKRNNMIYADYQQNRNPFIDHPEWVEQINNF